MGECRHDDHQRRRQQHGDIARLILIEQRDRPRLTISAGPLIKRETTSRMANEDYDWPLVADEGGYWDKPEPPYDSQYDLAEFVQLNTVIEAMAGIDTTDPTQGDFLRCDLLTVLGERAGGAASKVYRAVLEGELTPVVEVTFGEREKAVLSNLPHHIVREDTFNGFLSRLNMLEHPERTLYVLRSTARALWPVLDRRAPRPAEWGKCMRWLRTLEPPPLNDKAALKRLRRQYWWLRFPDKCLRREKWRGKHGPGAPRKAPPQ